MAPHVLLAVFVGSGLGLAACDQMHVQAGVLTHEAPGPFGQGWWVPLVFGVAGVVIVVVARLFAGDARRGNPVLAAAIFVAAYASTALFSEDAPYLLAAVLWATGLARLARDPDPPRAIAFALLLAASGPLVELAFSEAGLFAYEQDFATVAIWLSGLYVHGAPLALALATRTAPLPQRAPAAPAAAARTTQRHPHVHRRR